MQIESLDDRLRTDLWNVLYRSWFEYNANPYPYSLKGLWWHHFGLPIEGYNNRELGQTVREAIFEGEWFTAYDLLEYIASQTPDHYPDLVNLLNNVLEVNRAGYRIVAGQVADITDDTELQAIRDTAAQPPGSPARQHIEKALQLFADRDNPQYANSMKESISAVEAAARDTAGKPSATLGAALDEIAKQPQASMHSALLKGWKNIYGFTSDAGGIRHADSADSVPATQELAHYFLVTCSAMVNLLTTLQSKPH